MPRKTARPLRNRRGEHRFNEAAARCRGKPRQQVVDFPGVHASMRPRPDAAENGV